MRGEGWVEQGMMWRCTEMKGAEELSRVWRGRTGHRGCGGVEQGGMWKCGAERGVKGC